MAHYVVFCLDELRVAVSLSSVERVIRAVYLTHLPDAPDIVLGILNLQGRVIPAVNTRQRFRLPDREIAVTDQIVIAHTGRRTVGLVADAISGVIEYAEPDLVVSEDILPGLEYVDSVAKLDDGLILIHNLGRFLSLDEEESLDRAMETAGAH